jgi:2-oxoisovalerate dehydrogenase E1 component
MAEAVLIISGCVETTVLSIKGLKVAYPSNAADMKGLMKAAYYDPNPVVMLEHKGFTGAKCRTEDAKTPEPPKIIFFPLAKPILFTGIRKNQIMVKAAL